MSDSHSTGGDLVSLEVSLARETCVGCLGVWLPPSRWKCVPSIEDGGGNRGPPLYRGGGGYEAAA